ncbi:MAG: hypothetical protein ACKODH_16520 [Limisphaerales bacterium]
MHWCSVLLLAGLLAAGCAGPKAAPDGTVPPAPKAKGKSAPPPKPANRQPNPAPTIEPVSAFSGKVVLVNAPLKYIVVEGVLGRLPPPEQQLNVYRDGQKVGEVTVSAQMRGANFAADIALGDARVGDTVRSD